MNGLSLGDLERYFFEGCKDRSDLKVGVEWEKIGVYKENGEAIRYSGPRGVEVIFKALCRRFGWSPVFSGPHVIALKKKASSVTLEPGGQIELSGQKAETLKENADEFYSHLAEIKAVSEPLGVVWLGLGAQPVSTAADIEWVPKRRYQIMRESLRHRGRLTYSMMKETASVQVSLDYTSQSDAIEKFRLAMGLSPILSAMFANSPLKGEKFSGYLSRRSYIWKHTAPERTGVIPSIFDPCFDFSSYTRYALSVPLLFVVRKEKWTAVKRMTFGQFLKRGYRGLRATPADWELHLTSIFTEARLKKYIEIRCLDCQGTEMGLAAVAFLKGLFYDGLARRRALNLVAGMEASEMDRLRRLAPLKGLKTPFRGKTLLGAAQKLVGLAETGLQRHETTYLRPLKELILEQALSPAEALLERLGVGRSRSRWASLEKIVEYTSL